MNFKTLFSLILTFSIVACSNQPTHIIVSPVINYAPQSVYQGQTYQLNVSDFRTNNHVLQINGSDEKAKLYSSQKNISEIVNDSLTAGFKKQGLSIDEFANNTINVFIEQAKTSVNQEMVKYDAKNELVLRVEVSAGDQTLTKLFSSKGTSNGPLTADIAVLERDLNQQLGTLLAKIMQSPEIQQFIQSKP